MPTKTAETVQAHGMLYNAVAQTVVLYGRKSWVVMGEMLKVLEGFHHPVAWCITLIIAWSTEDGE